MSNDKEGFYRQIFLLVLGVIVGAVPSLFITTVQLRYQSQQALREKQIASLHGFAASINGGQKVLEKYIALDQSLHTLPKVPTQQTWDDFNKGVSESRFEYLNWAADMRTQAIVMESVFGASFPVPPFLPEIKAASPTTKAEVKQFIESEDKSIHGAMKSLVALMDTEQKVLNDIAKLVANGR